MPQTRSRRLLIIGGIVVALLVAGGTAAWFLFLKGDADPELKISDSPSGTGKAVDVAGLAGTWKVVPGEGDDATTAGYRVKEKFAGGARKVTANGRTPDVTGSLTVEGEQVTEAELTVDMTTLTSDKSQRDNVIRNDGLQTNQFPEGSFTLTEPIDLPAISDGKVFEAKATGELTLHGKTQPVTITISAKVSGDTVVIQGAAPIEMADYDIDPPSRGGFVEVDGNGTFEFLISFGK